MACFLNRPLDEQRQFVAKCLGYHPDEPKSWPMNIVDALISGAETAADRDLRDRIHRMTLKT